MDKLKRGLKRIPVIGNFLDFGEVDVVFLVILFALLAAGLVMVFSASMPTAAVEKNSGTAIFKTQLLWVVLGLALMAVISQMDLDFFYRGYRGLTSAGIYMVCLLLMVIALFMTDNDHPGFHRWIKIGKFSIQPSEFMKIAMIILLAKLMADMYSAIISKKRLKFRPLERPAKTPFGGFVKNILKKLPITRAAFPTVICGLVIVIPVILVILQNHNSGAVLLLLIGIVMLYVGEFKKGWFLTAAAAAFVLVAALYTIYKTDPELFAKIDNKQRLTSWIVKDYASTGTRWQINNALFAIGSGGFLGVGLGNSVQKYYYVPEPQNDMIFSILCEEFGFVGAALLLIVFAALIIKGVFIGLKARSRFEKYLAIGAAMHIGIQVALNIAVVTELVPNTGVELPFFSSGGSSMIAFLADAGLILAVSKHSRTAKARI